MPQVEIGVDNPALLFVVFDAKSVSTGMSRELPGGATLTFESRYYVDRRDLGKIYAAAPEITFILTFGASVAASLVANWLYEKLTSKPTKKITIDREEVSITPEGLVRIISERIKVEK